MMMLIWVLVLAGAFVWLVQLGWGNRVLHADPGVGGAGRLSGHGHAVDTRNSAVLDAVDPVCAMPVPVDSGYAEVHDGRLLRFCSRRCLDTFDSVPQRYAAW
ncbi:MAG TPA: YHS domain-containing protein [Gemmatimonadaceae bacterium]